MTDKEFKEICSLQKPHPSILISYQTFNLTGKLIGCWQDHFVIDINGQKAIWPRDLCDIDPRTYHIPTYS